MKIIQRPRRLRQNPVIRSLVRETSLSVSSLIQPMFIVEGNGIKEPITSMPGQFRFSPDAAAVEASDLFEKGIKSVLLFGIPKEKDETGSSACKSDGVVQKGLSAIKYAVPDMLTFADVCLCEYTSHGHCGILCEDGRIDNDSTLKLLCDMSLSLVRAGADVIAPSDMMDGRVGAIREALDAESLTDTLIMSYSAKYSSAFYGPFREAAMSAPKFGDRKSYQMDPANSREALREVALDIEEGADIVMVKPAMAYLDVIKEVRQNFDVPIAAYNVSGEYSMIKAAAERGWIDGEKAMLESLLAIKRAGADIIITYFAKDFAIS